MKNQTLRILATMFAFAGLLLSIACSPATPPANQANVKPANSANTEPAAAALDDACDDDNTTEQKVVALNAKIAQRFKDDPKFKEQYEGTPGKPPIFRFWVVNNGGVIELMIKGKVRGKDKNGNSKLEGILDIIDGYLDKTSCIQKVKFIPGVITGPTDLAPTSEGFEWIVCESPQVACSGGRCMDDPPGCAGIGSGNANTTVPGNSNANTGANTVSNSNKP